MARDADARDYHRLFRETAVATLVLDVPRRQVIDANDAAHRLLALTDGEFGAVAAQLVAEREVSGVNIDRAGVPPRAIRRIDTADGPRTVEVIVLPPDADGITFVQVNDVTELLSTNAALVRHTTELEARVATLDTLSARMAHDLRGPLATIAGFVDLLRGNGADFGDEQRAAILDRVSANAHSLATMVSEMLDEARRSGQAGTTAVDDLFTRLHEIFDAEVADPDARLTTRADVSELPVPVSALRQVVVNLVDNSIKFRDPDRPLEVIVQIDEEDDATSISVIDNGSGIEGDPEALFESGTRGHNAHGVVGSGLGLAYARREVESLGGALLAEPRDDGATFRVVLPNKLAVERPAVPDLFAGGLSAFQIDRIIDVAPVAMFLVDLASQSVVRVNAAASRLLDLRPEELVGRPATDLFDDDGLDGLRGPLLTGTGGRHGTITRVHAGDRRFPAAVWMVGFDDSALLVVQVHDLTGLVD